MEWENVRTGSKWTSMRTEEIILNAAIIGCLVYGFVLYTQLSPETSFLPHSLCLRFSVQLQASIGFMQMAESGRGFIESVCIIICVGFSIDYAAHLQWHTTSTGTSSDTIEHVRHLVSSDVVTAWRLQRAAAVCLASKSNETSLDRCLCRVRRRLRLVLCRRSFLFLVVLVGPIGDQGCYDA